jgi:hypothetical protein
MGNEKYVDHLLVYDKPVVVLDVARELAKKSLIPEFKIYSMVEGPNGIRSFVHGGACINCKPASEAVYFTLDYCPGKFDTDPRFSSVTSFKVSGKNVSKELVAEVRNALGGG